jgi:hypothetical protein
LSVVEREAQQSELAGRVEKRSVPRSTAIAIVVARNDLATDPIWKTVRVSTGAGSALPRVPKPLA